MPMRLHHPLPGLPPRRASGRRPAQRGPARRWTGFAYAAVLLAALGSAWLQPGRAEEPAIDDALLTLADWAGGGLAGAVAPNAGTVAAPAAGR